MRVLLARNPKEASKGVVTDYFGQTSDGVDPCRPVAAVSVLI